jgi:hypothetical protein
VVALCGEYFVFFVLGSKRDPESFPTLYLGKLIQSSLQSIDGVGERQTAYCLLVLEICLFSLLAACPYPFNHADH